MAPLPLDSAIELVLARGLRGLGPLGTTAARSLAFRTYGPIRLADVRCPRATGPRCQAHRDLTVVLSNPVDSDEFKAHFKAPDLPRHKPEVDDGKQSRQGKHDKNARKPGPSAEQRVAADPDFGKRYHLRVTAGLRDVFGQVLDHDLTVDVDTEAPFVPAVAGGSPVSAPAPGSSRGAGSDPDDSDSRPAEPAPPSPDDPRPHRPRLDYDLAIGLQGHVVEALAKRGTKSHQVPIGAMNIPSYAMTASRLREQEALSWLDRTARRAGDDPALWKWTWINPSAPENVRAVRTVDLDALLGGPGARGAALLAVALPGNMGDPTAELVTVTDLAVTAKVSRYGSVVWVTRLSTARPSAAPTVAIRKANKPDLYATTTDASGLATIPADRYDPLGERGRVEQDAFLFVRKDDDWTYQRVERAAASYRGGVGVDLDAARRVGGMVYTDRGVYRPGETVKLAGVFRRVDAAGIRSSPGEAVRIAVTDASGETVFDGRASLDAFGADRPRRADPQDRHLGEARIVAPVGRQGRRVVRAASAAGGLQGERVQGRGRPPTRRNTCAATRRASTCTPSTSSGRPMGAAPRSTTTCRAPRVRFAPPQLRGLRHRRRGQRRSTTPRPTRTPRSSASTTATLDEDGRSRDPRPRAAAHARPREGVFETEVEDLTHQTVARRAAVRVHPAAFYSASSA